MRDFPVALGVIGKAFSSAPASIAYVGNSANYGVGPDFFLGDYRVVCLDHSPLVDALRMAGRSVFCLEEELGQQNALFRSTARLLEHERSIDYLKAEGVTHLMIFKPSSKAELAAAANGWRILASPASLAQRLENKFNLEEIAGRAGVKPPLSAIFRAEEADFDGLAFKVGLPFVVQAAKGFAGGKTFLVGSPSDFEEAIERARSRVLKASMLVAGMPVTVNAVVTSRGVAVGWPSYQITGKPECTSNPLGSCGNDLAFGALEGRAREVREVAVRVGQVIGEMGYRGLFGVDLVISPRGPVLIEVNPRMTASLPLHTVLSIEREKIPLLALHVADFLDLDLVSDMKAVEDDQERVEAASVVIYNREGAPVQVVGELEAGVYRLDENGELAYVRTGTSISDCRSPDEVFISAAARGKSINPDVEIARIYLRRGVLAPSEDFLPEIKRLIDAVKKKLLTPPCT